VQTVILLLFLINIVKNTFGMYCLKKKHCNVAYSMYLNFVCLFINDKHSTQYQVKYTSVLYILHCVHVLREISSGSYKIIRSSVGRIYTYLRTVIFVLCKLYCISSKRCYNIQYILARFSM
jgi:hypothetical protein